MPYLYLLRHPRTHVDPTRPSHEWGLSEQGRAQVGVLANAPFCKVVQAIYASNQPKAIEPATAIGAKYGIPVTAIPGLGEGSRGTETYLNAADYDNALSKFFSLPDTSVAGWERATDALARFHNTMHEIVEQTANESIVVLSHSMVLTLYTAMLADEMPTLALWHAIDFATVAAVDLSTMQLVTPFMAAPYTDIPLP